MAMENIPWALLGGITSASIGRMLAYAATGGEEGVTGIGDFRVRQTAVASGNIRMDAGGAVLINRYPGVKNESYIVRAGDETQIAVPQNAGGTTRYDLVVARVDDWNFPGGQATPGTLPTDTVPAAKFEVITNVASSTKTAAQLNLNYPAVALALLAIPASTATITQAMIVDLREKAVPRRRRSLNIKAYDSGRPHQDLDSASGEFFPTDASWAIEVPYWATQMRVKAEWGGIIIRSGDRKGHIWARIGAGQTYQVDTEVGGWDAAGLPISVSTYYRETWLTGDTLPVPLAMRGQSVNFRLMGKVSTGTTGGYPAADATTTAVLDVEFLEAPTEDV